MKGDFVLVRGYMDTAYVCRVWDADEDIVEVASPSEYLNKINGVDSLLPVGFPRRFVFRYVPDAHIRLSRGEIEWSSLEVYGD